LFLSYQLKQHTGAGSDASAGDRRLCRDGSFRVACDSRCGGEPRCLKHGARLVEAASDHVWHRYKVLPGAQNQRYRRWRGHLGSRAGLRLDHLTARRVMLSLAYLANFKAGCLQLPLGIIA
jgi:hypothetical protein